MGTGAATGTVLEGMEGGSGLVSVGMRGGWKGGRCMAWAGHWDERNGCMYLCERLRGEAPNTRSETRMQTIPLLGEHGRDGECC